MNKKVIIGILVVLTLGIGGYIINDGIDPFSKSTQLFELLNSGSDIQIEMVVPAPSDEQSTQQSQHDKHWVELDQLRTNDMFRHKFDKAFNINIVTELGKDGKQGCLYVGEDGKREGNATFVSALRNKPFMEKYMKDNEVTRELGNLAQEIFIDIDENNSEAVYGALAEYYNLYDMSQKRSSEFKAQSILTREDFYSYLYRANNSVFDIQDDKEFNKAIKTEDYANKFASKVDKYAWLNIENNALRPKNYKSAITKAEVVYMLMNYYFSDELKDFDSTEVKLISAKDGGDMLNFGKEILRVENEETGEYEIARGWELGVLAKMVSSENTKNLVNTDIYKSLALAKNKGIINEGINWRDSVTRLEGIDYLVKINKVLNKEKGYKTEIEYGLMEYIDPVEVEPSENTEQVQVENNTPVEKEEPVQNENNQPIEKEPVVEKEPQNNIAPTGEEIDEANRSLYEGELGLDKPLEEMTFDELNKRNLLEWKRLGELEMGSDEYNKQLERVSEVIEVTSAKEKALEEEKLAKVETQKQPSNPVKQPQPKKETPVKAEPPVDKTGKAPKSVFGGNNGRADSHWDSERGLWVREDGVTYNPKTGLYTDNFGDTCSDDFPLHLTSERAKELGLDPNLYGTADPISSAASDEGFRLLQYME